MACPRVLESKRPAGVLVTFPAAVFILYNLLLTEYIHKNGVAGCWYLLLFSCTSSLGETGV